MALRGLVVFGVLILVIAFACIGPAFFWLPGANSGVALPVITLPAEVVSPNAVFGLDLTNTLTSLILVDVLLILIAIVVGRAYRSAPPERFVPKGFTNFIELIGSFLYNQAYNLLGNKTRAVFPMAATIFLMILLGNWIKLLPGYESVGWVACAEYNVFTTPSSGNYNLATGQVSYRISGLNDQGNPSGILSLNNGDNDGDSVLNLSERSGIKATRPQTLHCEEKHPWAKPPYAIGQEQDYIAAKRAAAATWNDEEEKKAKEAYHLIAELKVLPVDPAFIAEERAKYQAALLTQLEASNLSASDKEELKAAVEANAPNAVQALATALDAPSFDEGAARAAFYDKLKKLAEGHVFAKEGATLSEEDEQKLEKYEQEAKKIIEEAAADRFVIVPFFRGMTTDLNFPIALAVLVVIMVQVWGVQALGPAYFFKFINLPALGQASKGKALKGIDFIVGLVEIISEISRIVSLTFRLFGAVFAGGILLVVFSFLIAFLLPLPIYFLELFVGGIQAYVFAILTVIYASQAVVHHGDDDHGHDDGHGNGHH